MRFALTTLVGLVTALYPAAVYFGIQFLEPRLIALLLGALLLIRLSIGGGRRARPLFLVCLAYAGFTAWSNQIIALRFYPVVVNAAMLLIFGGSLVYPPSVIERLARLQTPELSEQGVIYTRRVTQVWCGFFLVNGGTALATALYASFETWSLYNGLIAYVLMGLLFAVEYVCRQRAQKQG